MKIVGRRPDGQNRPKSVSQSPEAKIILFYRIRNCRMDDSSHPAKGAVRESSRNAGRDAVDAGGVGARGNRRAGRTVSDGHRARRTAPARTAKACGPGCRCCSQALRRRIGPTGRDDRHPIREATVTKRNSSPRSNCVGRPVIGRAQGWRDAPPPPAAAGLDPVRSQVIGLGMRSADAERDCTGWTGQHPISGAARSWY